TNGYKLTVNAPSAPTLFLASGAGWANNAALGNAQHNIITTAASDIYAQASPGSANASWHIIWCSVTNGANAGTIALQFAESTASGTINLKAGSALLAVRAA